MKIMASLHVQNGGGTVEGTDSGMSYSDVLQGTVKVDSKPIFLKEADLFGNIKPTKEQWLTNIEIYKTLGATIPLEAISGIQRVGSLWRLYIENTVNRLLLLAKGVSLRGKTIQMRETHMCLIERSRYESALRISLYQRMTAL